MFVGHVCVLAVVMIRIRIFRAFRMRPENFLVVNTLEGFSKEFISFLKFEKV